MSAPIQTVTNGRTSEGRFAKGNAGGPGRPRRPDLYTVVAARAADNGVDLGTELWEVCQQLLAQAKGGNVQAARLLFLYLCGEPVSKSEVSLSVAAERPIGDVERAHRLQAIFSAAAARLESEGKTTEARQMRDAAGEESLFD